MWRERFTCSAGQCTLCVLKQCPSLSHCYHVSCTENDLLLKNRVMTHKEGELESSQVGEEHPDSPGQDKSPRDSRDSEGALTPRLPPINVKKPDHDSAKPTNSSKKNPLSGFPLVTETRRELLEELDSYRSSRDSTPADQIKRPHFLRPLTPRQSLSQAQYEQEEQLRQELHRQLIQLQKSQEERESLQYRYIVHHLRQDEDYDAMQYQDLLEQEHLQEQSTLSAQQQYQLFRQQLEEHLQQQQEQHQQPQQQHVHEQHSPRVQKQDSPNDRVSLITWTRPKTKCIFYHYAH